MASLVKSCTFCGNAIELNDKSGSFRAYNENGSLHSCLNKKRNRK